MTHGRPAPDPSDEPVDALPASTVTVYPDGPLIVRGDFELREVDGAMLAGGRTIALCRCGRSALKPFCDGSHKIRRVTGRSRPREES
jgi:CDGSH-type Zn-finger protein